MTPESETDTSDDRRTLRSVVGRSAGRARMVPVIAKEGIEGIQGKACHAW
jgi:hypothetical protein